jgi:hypothetical protein
MRIEDLIKDINKLVENLDLVTARKLIENNLGVLNDNKKLLNSNGRELLKFFTERLESGYQQISREEMATITAINSYASNFDIRSIKFLLKNNTKFLLRNDVNEYLNNDAKAILIGMGAIGKNNN